MRKKDRVRRLVSLRISKEPLFRGKIVNIVQKDGIRLEENDISARQQLVFYKEG